MAVSINWGILPAGVLTKRDLLVQVHIGPRAPKFRKLSYTMYHIPYTVYSISYSIYHMRAPDFLTVPNAQKGAAAAGRVLRAADAAVSFRLEVLTQEPGTGSHSHVPKIIL